MTALLASIPVAAEAHNGVGASFKGHAGPYTVYGYDGYELAHGEIEYKLVLLTADGEPADDVAASIVATKPGAPGTPADAHSYANVVFYDLPNPYPADWEIHLRLTGKPGTGRVTFRMHGLQPVDPAPLDQPAYTVDRSRPTGWLVAAGIAGAFAATVAVVMWTRQRRQQSIGGR